MYKASLTVSVVLLVFLLLAILEVFYVPAILGNVLTVLWLLAVVASVGLFLVIRKARCPVCRYVFVGKREPMIFAKTCRNCGRRSGDTG
jgi:hypothetical protein